MSLATSIRIYSGCRQLEPTVPCFSESKRLQLYFVYRFGLIFFNSLS